MMKQWHNCYDSGWKGIIVPEAFSHPAKMSYGLLKRILEHARDEKWICPRDIVVDPFGGIGSTGIIGAYADLRVICVELEAKFCKLAEQNFELHDNAWRKFGHPYPIILQGDSRRLCEVVEKADCIISSPPFQGVNIDENILHGVKVNRNTQCVRTNRPKNIGKNQKAQPLTYGQTPGQLGSMKPGKVDMVVSSPPYAETQGLDYSKGVSNKPYKGKGHSWGEPKNRPQQYSNNPSNLGNLKSGDVDCVISSPPFLDPSHGRKKAENGYFDKVGGIGKHCRGEGDFSKKNLYFEKTDDTFWAAAKTIVEQCHQILKPGGHAIWVVKSFVRKGKIVDFPGDWQRLCESVGFKTVCVHHAMLVKETTYKTLFGDIEVKKIERKSFFRRLAESKGSPRIDFEVVLCMETQNE